DNEYQRIIDYVYNDEKEYDDLYKDIMHIGDILKDYAQTNFEYYSANIFNEQRENCKRNKYLIINKNKYNSLFGEKFKIKDCVYVKERNCIDKCDEYIYLDFYNNVIVFLNVSQKIIDEVLHIDLGANNEESISELLEILNNVKARKKFKYYKLSDLKYNISDEMSVQFVP
ncbi:MAG: hypothetical protein NC124_16550, partial [Clostridium sp.]|nr:hypothetical protein [Clostridium sp.]